MRNRIGTFSNISLKTLAVFFDILSFFLNFAFPIVGGLIAAALNIIVMIIMFVWFKVCGVKFSDRILARIWIMIVTKVFPIVNMAPTLSLSVWTTIRIVRKEDKEANEKEQQQMALEYAALLYAQQQAATRNQQFARRV